MDKKWEGFIDFLKKIPDHRIERRKLHCIEEILLLTFCGVLAGCDSWEDLELFGKTKLGVLQAYLPFKNGAPSDETLRRFFRVLEPEKFEACFIEWVKLFQLNLKDKMVAIDNFSTEFWWHYSCDAYDQCLCERRGDCISSIESRWQNQWNNSHSSAFRAFRCCSSTLGNRN